MMAVLGVQQATEYIKALPGVFDNKMELTLNEQGIICDCNIPVGDLFGYRRSELAWRHISELMPELAGIKLMHDGRINPRLHFLSHIGHRFQLLGLGGKLFEVKLFIRDMEIQGRHDLRAMIFPVEEEFDAAGIS